MLEVRTLETQLRDKKAEMQKLIPALTEQERLLMDLPAIQEKTPEKPAETAKPAKKT
jgi:hypothetical protein